MTYPRGKGELLLAGREKIGPEFDPRERAVHYIVEQRTAALVAWNGGTFYLFRQTSAFSGSADGALGEAAAEKARGLRHGVGDAAEACPRGRTEGADAGGARAPATELGCCGGEGEKEDDGENCKHHCK